MAKDPTCLDNLHLEALVSVSPSRQLPQRYRKPTFQRLSRNIGIQSKFVCEKGQFSDLAKAGVDKIIDRLDYKG